MDNITVRASGISPERMQRFSEKVMPELENGDCIDMDGTVDEDSYDVCRPVFVITIRYEPAAYETRKRNKLVRLQDAIAEMMSRG